MIIAEPSALTGSIGIFGGRCPAVSTKLGARIRRKRQLTRRDRLARVHAGRTEELQEQLQAFYDQFVEKAADSRRTTAEKIDQLAQGRVWTGRQARDNGLVDELGGLDRAIAEAKRHAKISAGSEVTLVVFPPRRSFYELIAEQFGGASDQLAIGSWLSTNLTEGELAALRTIRGPLALFRRGEPLALMPSTVLR